MGGKQKQDIAERINYLFQAAHAVLRENPDNIALVRYYCQNLSVIAKKNVLRLAPEIKRYICKKCFCLLIPGITCRVRVKDNRQKRVSVICLHCDKQKHFLAVEYSLWIEKLQQQTSETNDA
jgi:ribonuclease P protein subunit RPR2